MGKIVTECEFGVTHSTAQCRCMDNHVTNRQVKCNVPEQHGPFSASEIDSTPTALDDRLRATVNGFLGGMGMPIAIETMVDLLAADVDAWLLDSANYFNEKESNERED